MKLLQEQREGQLAWLIGGAAKSGAMWIFWRGGNTKRFRLTNQQFKDAIRMRLLLPVANGMKGTKVTCQCSHEVSMDESYHILPPKCMVHKNTT